MGEEMSKFTLSQRSLERLQGLHPDLVAVVKRAIEITPIDFSVIEGVRTVERQKQLLAAGASKTMKSRHIPSSNKSGMGEAVDLAPIIDGQIRWDWPLFHKLAPAVKEAANQLGVPIQWGGDWRTFKDGPHFEIKR